MLIALRRSNASADKENSQRLKNKMTEKALVHVGLTTTRGCIILGSPNSIGSRLSNVIKRGQHPFQGPQGQASEG